jgi:hypothetical protein
MFSKLSALALLIPFVSAVTLQIPEGIIRSSSQVTINWTKEPSDDVFSIYLFNPIFSNSFAIANNVNPADESITLTLPVVPAGDGYTLAAVNITNINDVYSQTASFNIAEQISSTASSTSSAASSSGSSSASTTGAVSGSGSSGSPSPTSTSRFGVTVSGSSTASQSSGTGASGSSSSSATSPSASNFNNDNGAVGLVGAGAGKLAALTLAVIAGGAMIVL